MTWFGRAMLVAALCFAPPGAAYAQELGGDTGADAANAGPASNEAPAPDLSQMPEAPFDEADTSQPPSILIVRLSDALASEQRDAALRVIETLPTVTIGAKATHEIGPNPSLSDIVALYEIPGAIPSTELAPQLSGRGITTPQQLFAFYADDFRADHAWASNLAPPVELGDLAQPGFEDRLRAALLTIARKEALLSFGQSSSKGTISLCLSNEPPPAGHCPLPLDGRGWNEVSHEGPIYLSVETRQAPIEDPAQPRLKARFFTIVAVSRAGEIIPIASGQGQDYVFEDTANASADAPRPVPEVRLFFAPPAPLNDQLAPGHYDLIVIVAEEPAPPDLWQRPNNGADPAQVCPQTRWLGLCRAMQARWGSLAFTMENDVARIPIGVTREITRVLRVVRGSVAARSVSLWQAQLYRYRAEDVGQSARTFDFKKAHRCGGAYLGDGFVLTAAHCIPRNVSEMRVRLGTRDLRSGGSSFPVRSLVLHKDGNSRTSRVDLALLQLRAAPESLRDLGDNLQPITPSRDTSPDFTRLSGLTATGWGLIKKRLPGESGWMAADGSRNAKADRLQQVVLIQPPMSRCEEREEYSAYLAQDMLCLRGLIRGTDTCAGDSGGPVSARANGRRELVGIVSTGVGCAYRGVPAVYVNVARHRGWISRAKDKMLVSGPGYFEMD